MRSYEAFNSFCMCNIQTGWQFWLNTLTPMSDQDRISPYNINTILSSHVMGTEKNIN